MKLRIWKAVLAAAVLATVPSCGPEDLTDEDFTSQSEEELALPIHNNSYVLTADATALRSGPATTHPVVKRFPAETRLYVTTGPFNDGWYRLRYQNAAGEDRFGYARRRHLKYGQVAVVHKLPTNAKVIALTFDAGSDFGDTGRILDLLDRQGVVGTFGLTGKWADLNPGAVERIRAKPPEGSARTQRHQIINHTFSHRSFVRDVTTYAERKEELAKAEQSIRNALGNPSFTAIPYWRPPFGDGCWGGTADAGVKRDVFARGYLYCLMWTVDSLGWMPSNPDRNPPWNNTPENVAERVWNMGVDMTTVGAAAKAEALRHGGIVLLHVGAASTDYEALASIISRFKADGYTFARLSDYELVAN
jgi:peptidoglycan/xylan/chitin deacetylase (PgdA/CDA1 family)